MGIGAIPDAVLAFLGDKHDLGIHSEMFSDGIMDLVERGVITGNRKKFLPGKDGSRLYAGHRAPLQVRTQQPHDRECAL